MEPSTNQLTQSKSKSTSRRGVALVIVLCMLVLISGIVVAFFSSVSSEYLTAKSASAGANGKELADSTVQIVMSQIRQATSKGSNVCWASQPGMIRTYGLGTAGNYTASSAPLAFYKLYSSGTMVVSGTSFTPEKDIPSSTWPQQPALYTDLNAPVAGTSGTSYPIIDPRAANIVSGTNSLVEGFSITTSGSNPAPVATTGTNPNPVPMPVKWIYVLRDGTLITPDAASSGSSAVFTTGTTVPTTTNPIVGRVAFWTDDETCKLNLNTACGGTYWEQPVFASDMDLAFSRYKPVAKEYNRYPGHPATTSLTPVFWSFEGLSDPYQNLFPDLTNSTHTMGVDLKPFLSTTGTTAFQNLLQFSPRNAWGGSMMGTVATEGYGVTTGSASIIPDSDRLYASVDEAIFGYKERGTVSSGSANVFSSGTNQLDNDHLKKLRFFLTTTSRSPETNPFNQPKVGIWPVPEVSGTRTAAAFRSAADNLIAFCSTLTPGTSGTYPYYFTRGNAQSATADWTTRNSQIFDYLDTAFQNPIPGFGASVDSRYTVNGGRRILTLIYDYIRSTFNLLDTSFGYTGSGSNLFYNNTFMGAANNPQGYAFGQVVPIQITKDGTTYKGAGRFPLIKQVAIMFMARASNQPPLVCFSNGKPYIYSLSSGTNVAASGTSYSYQNNDGSLNAAGLQLVLSGLAGAQLNPTHPWVSGTFAPGDTVPQFKDPSGHPVLIVTGTDLSAPSSFFPVFSSKFGTVSGTSTTDLVSGSTATFSLIANQYPTLYGSSTKNGYWGIIASGSTGISGTTTYAIAATSSTSGILNLPQTHAGMPYLTVQSLATGAFTQPNPRYQGKNINASYELPDPVNLPPGSTEMQALFLVDPVNVAPGNTPLIPKYQVTVSRLNNFQANRKPLRFGVSSTQSNQQTTYSSTIYHNLGMQTISIGTGCYMPTRTSTATNQNQLNWIGTPVIMSGTSFIFSGGTITVDMYAPPLAGGNPVPVVTTGANASTLVQTYNIQFPNDTFPTPLLPQMPSNQAGAQVSNTLLSGITSSAPQTPPNAILPNILYNANNDPGAWSNSNTAFLQKDASGNYLVPLNVPSRIADLVPSSLLTSDASSSLSKNPNIGVGASFICPITSDLGVTTVPQTASYCSDASAITTSTTGISGKSRFCYGAGNDTAMLAYFLPQRNGYPGTDSRVKLACDTIRAVECLYGDPRVFASLPVVGTQFFKPHRFYSDLDMRAAHTFRGAIFGQYPDSSRNCSSNYRGATDHNLSDAYVADPSWNYNPWAPAPGVLHYDNASMIGRKQGTKIDQLGGSSAHASQNGGLRSQAPYTTSSSEFSDTLFAATSVWSGATKFSTVWAAGGDFSNGVGSEPDGPYINKPNEAGGLVSVGTTAVSYYPEWWNYNGTDAFTLSSQFSPNRLISSPVAFGCLPAPSPLNSTPGTPSPTDAWHTLLFCANPNASTPTLYANRMAGTDVTLANQIPSGAKCPDHLLLDFFTMPVVEPYAISEPFSTAGKVNMNYQIAPFSYIKRETALRGVFRGTMLTAVNDQFVPSKTGNEESFYKSNIMNTSLSAVTFATAVDTYGKFLNDSGNWGFRYPIHAGETLKQFQQRFDNGDIFRSPSEICSLFLYPATQLTPATSLVSWDANSDNIKNWWYADAGGARKSLTGDNERERPYDTLYPRLTTKSNSYTVHFRVQVLKQDKSGNATTWTENPARVVSEYRGSTLIERYIDPNDTALPDFATTNDTLDNYYKFRVVNTKKFTAE